MQCGSVGLMEPRPLSGSQLIRVRDNAMEQHGPSVCGSYKQRLNSTKAGGPRRTAPTWWSRAVQAASNLWLNNNVGHWNECPILDPM